jgi:hypothetical protein
MKWKAFGTEQQWFNGYIISEFAFEKNHKIPQ